MTMDLLDRQLAALGIGDRICLGRSQCEALFEPGLATVTGRQRMYELANARNCDVQWADTAIAFLKR